MSVTIKVTRLAIKKCEAEWYNYYDTLREISRLREEIQNPFVEFPDENTGGGSNSVRNISDPTSKVATRLATSKQLNYLGEITNAIERVYGALPDNYKELVKLRYWNKQERLTWIEIGERLNISERQARRWRNEVVQVTIEMLGWR